MLRRSLMLFCEEEHGFGDVTFPETANDVEWISPPSAVHLRRMARAVGWQRINGADYCPNCVDSITGRER